MLRILSYCELKNKKALNYEQSLGIIMQDINILTWLQMIRKYLKENFSFLGFSIEK